mmetsp:Transcript_442/g.837  ORF Transcript_442/g.837 Transcript_442/m.837 type:complete len:340 (+) Transcript_442:976-1995(+)
MESGRAPMRFCCSHSRCSDVRQPRAPGREARLFWARARSTSDWRRPMSAGSKDRRLLCNPSSSSFGRSKTWLGTLSRRLASRSSVRRCLSLRMSFGSLLSPLPERSSLLSFKSPSPPPPLPLARRAVSSTALKPLGDREWPCFAVGDGSVFSVISPLSRRLPQRAWPGLSSAASSRGRPNNRALAFALPGGRCSRGLLARKGAPPGGMFSLSPSSPGRNGVLELPLTAPVGSLAPLFAPRVLGVLGRDLFMSVAEGGCDEGSSAASMDRSERALAATSWGLLPQRVCEGRSVLGWAWDGGGFLAAAMRLSTSMSRTEISRLRSLRFLPPAVEVPGGSRR